MAMALAPLAPYAKALALQGISSALPTLGKVLGNNLFTFGKPSVKKFLSGLAQKAGSAEGREQLLNLASKGVRTGHDIFGEGVGLAQQFGLSKQMADHLRSKAGAGKADLQGIFGALSKVNKRILL